VLGFSLPLTLLLGLGLGSVLFAGRLVLSRREALTRAQHAGSSLNRAAVKRSPLHAFMAQLLEERDEKRSEQRKRQLFQAGFPGPNQMYYFTISKLVVGTLTMCVMAVLIAMMPALHQPGLLQWPIFLSLSFLLGFALPGVVVALRAQRYVDRIAKGLPDALDLMLVCVEAGQSLDISLVRVARLMRDLHPELAERFAATADALKAGENRESAFNKLAYLTDNADLAAFARVMLQASEMGTPVADTFRVFAADQRTRRMRRIEEQANVLPTKMTLGTMIFTVPPFLLLMLTPAIYSILNGF